jgi:hypothetical protein
LGLDEDKIREGKKWKGRLNNNHVPSSICLSNTSNQTEY